MKEELEDLLISWRKKVGVLKDMIKPNSMSNNRIEGKLSMLKMCIQDIELIIKDNKQQPI